MSFTERIPIPSPESINSGLTSCPPSLLVEYLGQPREHLTDDCEQVTNPLIKRLLTTRNVGAFTVTGLIPAVDALQRVMRAMRAGNRPLYDAIQTAGMLCCRRVRGTTSTPSGHSFGTAIDIEFGGILDTVGDGKCQRGLLEAYKFFKVEKFYWGAEFKGPREDAMHFEASAELVREWHQNGRLR